MMPTVSIHIYLTDEQAIEYLQRKAEVRGKVRDQVVEILKESVVQ